MSSSSSLLARAVYFIALLGLCAAYIQGGLLKLGNFPAAIAEMSRFGLAPPAGFAVAVIAIELVAPAMILSGRLRWLGALALCVLTLLAAFFALRFWQMPPGQARVMAATSFFEHLGLAGGMLLVAWLNLTGRDG